MHICCCPWICHCLFSIGICPYAYKGCCLLICPFWSMCQMPIYLLICPASKYMSPYAGMMPLLSHCIHLCIPISRSLVRYCPPHIDVILSRSLDIYIYKEKEIFLLDFSKLKDENKYSFISHASYLPSRKSKDKIKKFFFHALLF